MLDLVGSVGGYSILLLLAVSQLLYYITIRYRPGLRKLPGPFLASVSDLDRLWSCAKGLQMNYHLRLHDHYGPLVRIGPKHVSFSDATLIPLVYGISTKFWKSDFYKMFDIKAPTGWAPTTFSVRDEDRHKAMKRPVASAFSMSSLKELEPMNDDCSAIFSRKLEGFVGQEIDLGQWVHWYAFDVISSITFSNRIGFMEQETDVNNIIAAIEGRLVYNSIVGQAPYLHKYLFGNSIVAWLASFIPAIATLNSSRYIVAFAAKQLQRYQSKNFNAVDLRDMLDRFRVFKDGKQVMSDSELLSHASSNIFAGADTTAASLRAVFYYLCRNSQAHQKLLAEIDEADRKGELSDPVTFTEAQDLKYFQAVVKEALRMHPAVGLLMERVVPEGGADVGGVWLSEGTIIGMNSWVAARDRAVYGEDAYEFRPERWLEADEIQLKLMDRNFLAFGAGARTCLGKNISLLEMSKLVPQLLRRFDFELADPSKEWTLHDYWFVKQTGLICKVKRRG
ncbi:hypothetical protein LTR36_010758 [Oleoguttula mirabilis]|uniref:Cytochrome P450 n=1 Tax=Oleoguttula mirabilis TaxID=1507867 RepID=A0AAV9JRA7_9PEZI|nr:hypothetical protein LTR36_010758 [Oleoguttula mirabilis]